MNFNNKEKYKAPEKLKNWISDVTNGERYEVYISSDKKVWCLTGRFSHSSGATSSSWSSFLDGELNDLVLKTMGQSVLNQVKAYLKNHGS
ncbi:hypothetical protein QFX18_19200 [Saccharophagus degradans]|uniref:hypothetical protein n=1 Tax=Saccharophagus degradans TaxID=86304 RepID=UPI002477EB06|nr:hypothetical protein [Saccharophagus degradans]WGO98137.1 hypothetical protein QFX18_19200 [Saccharophagus degradans]